MNEIDLFPEDLRQRLNYRRWFKRAAIIAVLSSAVILTAFGGLYQMNKILAADIQTIQDQREISNANRKRLENLTQRRDGLQQQLDLLSGLRSGASAEQMFVMLDRALPGPEVWLTNWKFRRAGTQVDAEQETVSTGYFIVIPAGSDANGEETWRIKTQMNIQGQALDHSAISEFVMNLTRQPEIETVRIVNTRLGRAVNETKLVDFSLDITVSTSASRV